MKLLSSKLPQIISCVSIGIDQIVASGIMILGICYKKE